MSSLLSLSEAELLPAAKNLDIGEKYTFDYSFKDRHFIFVCG